jgi:hypothetical protein
VRVDRLAVAAHLKPGSRRKAEALIAEGPPFELNGSGFRSHGVYLSDEEVVFVFEGPGAEYLVLNILNDPVRAARFDAWAPLLEGSPRLVRETWHWSRSADAVGAGRPPGL